jgi:glycerol uptake facilitator-like aquaporin
MSLRRYASEFLGTAALLATVVGSGIMAEQLAQGNMAVALLANAGATAGMLYVLIVTLGPIGGAHFNPAVTLVLRLRGEIDNATAAGYVVAQILGAVGGTLLAHGMFELDLLQPGDQVRSGAAQSLSEGVATFGLIATMLLGAKYRAAALPALVASYIFAAYWFTASTSFANPAVTLARALTQTFSGIRPLDAPAFIAAQLAGAVLALMAITALTQEPAQSNPPR